MKQTESEACYKEKKKISSVKKSATKKMKNAINLSKTKVVKKIKVKKEFFLQTKTKKNKIKQKPQLTSVESILVETAKSKKQISHLKVSIEKNSRLKNLGK